MDFDIKNMPPLAGFPQIPKPNPSVLSVQTLAARLKALEDKFAKLEAAIKKPSP